MAPEQASGNVQEIGPRCDIYALGAILYELLTGRPPFVAETALDTLQLVLRQEPVPPTRLQPGVPRDLETICLKCLEKDPAKRYATAGGIADDLERFLKGEPIFARRAGPAARLLRWSRRRPAAAALVLVSVFASAALLAGSSWSSFLVRTERDRAEENFRLALKAVDGMLTEVGEVDFAYEPRLDEKRRALLERALSLYQEFLARQADDRRLQLETAQAFRRVGDIERWLGDQGKAEDAYVQAIQLIDRLRTDQPSNPTYRRWLAYCHDYLGEVHRVSSNPRLAEQAYRRALELTEALHREFPATVEFAQELARAQYNAGILYRETNRYDEAERILSRSAGLLRSLSAQNAGDASVRQELARVYINLGTVFRATGRPGHAVEHNDDAIELLTALAAQFPQRPDYRFELAVVHANRGNIHARNGEPGRGRKDYKQASTLLTKLIADYPSAPALRQELANTCNSLGAMQASTGDLAGAEETWTRAVGLLRELVAQHASAPVYRADLGMTLGNLGWALAEQKRFDQARQMLGEGVDQLADALRSNPEHPDYGLSLSSQLKELGRLSLETNDHVAAVDAARQLATRHGGSANDALSAACVMVRAAAAAEQDAGASGPDRAVVVERYCEEAAALVRAAASRGVSDTALLEQARGIFQSRIAGHESLRAAYGLLFAPAPMRISEQRAEPTP
jgi:tetratricopeptide (TPR) repeat protein